MKIIFLWFPVFLFYYSVSAQHNELGVFLGGSYYIGDLNPSRQFYLTKPAAGGLYRHNFNSRISLRLSLFDGSVEGSDAKSKTNVIRNLSFKSDITELATIIEINFLPFLPGKTDHRFTSYIFWGFSAFKFNPKAEYQGEWYDLQPQRTEGQKKPYHLISMSMPFGFGMKFNLSKRLTIAGEWGLRKTFTDYLDDVSTVYVDPANTNFPNLADRSTEVGQPKNVIGSQRGDSQNKDWYSFFGLTLTFKLRDPKAPCYAFPKEGREKIYQRIINFKKLNLFNVF